MSVCDSEHVILSRIIWQREYSSVSFAILSDTTLWKLGINLFNDQDISESCSLHVQNLKS